MDKKASFPHSSQRNGWYSSTVLETEKDFNQLKTFPISVLKSNWPDYKHTCRVLKCLKLIRVCPLPMPLKSKLTISIWMTWVALLTLADSSYFQSHIIQLPFLATLDSANLLAKYTTLTMGYSGTPILESVIWHRESTSLPQSLSQVQMLLLAAIKARLGSLQLHRRKILVRLLPRDNVPLCAR